MTDFRSRLEDIKSKLKLTELVNEKELLLKEMEAGDFWDNSDLAQKKSQRLSEINSLLESVSLVENTIGDAETAAELGDEVS
ncbi:MAG: hypothetical protein DPW11_03930, partial [bacterium]|nr:hypothetical protein [bacterium]